MTEGRRKENVLLFWLSGVYGETEELGNLRLLACFCSLSPCTVDFDGCLVDGSKCAL